MSQNHADTPLILVVDDEPDWTTLIETWLKDTYRIRTASDGTEALDAYTPEVDLVLLDRHMPGPSGYEVCEELRDRGAMCPVVMLTGVDPEMDLADVPFDDYLSKPVTESEVRDVVELLLTVSAYDNALRDLYTATAKIATLKTEYDTNELQDDERYQTLLDRRDKYREQVDQMIDEIDSEAAFRELMSDLGDGGQSEKTTLDHSQEKMEVDD